MGRGIPRLSPIIGRVLDSYCLPGGGISLHRRIIGIGAIAALITVGAFTQSSQGQYTLARIFGDPFEAEFLMHKRSGQAVTLESIQKQVEWRQETLDKLRQVK